MSHSHLVNIFLQFWLIGLTLCDLDNDDGSGEITDWSLFLIENRINRQLTNVSSSSLAKQTRKSKI